MRRVVLISSLVLLTLSSGIAGSASAQAPEPSAFELSEKARRAQDAGRLNEAIDGYARAYQLSGDPGYLYSLAEAQRRAGHREDALRTLQTYVRRDPNGPNRAVADSQIAELEKQVAEVRRANAKGVAPVGLLFPPGTAPAPATAPAPPPAATAPPPAPVSPAPAAAAPLIVADAPAPTPAAGEPAVPRWVPWVLTTATVGLGVAAIVSGVSASNRYDELHDSCGMVAGGCAAADIDDVKSRARRANILWALTSVAAVGAGVTIYLNVDAAGASGLWRF